MATLRFGRLNTPLGPMLAAATDHGLAALATDGDVGAFLATLRRRFPRLEPMPDALDDVADWVRGYLAGRRATLPPVDLRGLTEFDARVYEAVRAVPYGATATYGEIAASIGAPRAARAVGGAMSRCPLFPAVPCHRIVRASDGFSGWGGPNLAQKRRLLNLERRGARRASAIECRRTGSGSIRGR